MRNHLKDQTSPYLLQHADNPVNWYPWCDEAFELAKSQDKPVFLSIGYSTCHWCHVMAHESFEDERIAEILNRYFVSVKVDKEERPDIDSIYMSVCQALTGSGGWPTTVLLTPKQKPFFAGTYFPKTSRYGQIGLEELLLTVHQRWETDRQALLESAEEILSFLDRKKENAGKGSQYKVTQSDQEEQLISRAFTIFKNSFDQQYGGFGNAPKFPTPHNLLFLMKYYEKNRDAHALKMAEKTLLQMYLGGMFDHVGGGFSRYSTDRFFLVPHFEKMLYDNALLILAYCKAYQLTKNPLYCEVAQRTGEYILREMTAPEGGFYSAQDADSEGVEGKYYLFEPSEIIKVLGEKEGRGFNRQFDITEKGNFEGKNIPNLLKSHSVGQPFREQLSAVCAYRRNRYQLHLDDKILTSWNGLMITAMCHLYRVTGTKKFLEAALSAQDFIWKQLQEKGTLYVSFRNGRRSGKGFLEDYSNTIFALCALYEATLDSDHLNKAQKLCEKAVLEFYDKEQGGFFLYGKENEQLILRPKETYDGAVFSGNSAMAYNLVRLYYLTGEKKYEEQADRQLAFMCREAQQYPAGYAMFLIALWDYLDPPEKITVVLKGDKKPTDLPCGVSPDTVLRVLEGPAEGYPLKNDRTTFYVCRGRSCQPPVNELDAHEGNILSDS